MNNNEFFLKICLVPIYINEQCCVGISVYITLGAMFETRAQVLTCFQKQFFLPVLDNYQLQPSTEVHLHFTSLLYCT